MKKAFITGISGQTGSYLAEYLIDKGYEVHGLIRRSSIIRGLVKAIYPTICSFKNGKLRPDITTTLGETIHSKCSRKKI